MIGRLTEYEQAFYAGDVTLLAGMDEVGRGPLAGPVLACALILPRESAVDGVDDSKKLSEKKRAALYDRIMAGAVSAGIGRVDNDEIDEINILRATHKAMAEALAGLSPQPGHVLIDGLPVPGLRTPHTAVAQGDARCYLIAAASIVAKVTRDRLMIEYDGLYPEYGFAANKGYGTKSHMAAIERHGLSPIHRKSFCGKLVRRQWGG